jgi:hypothetical protein
MPAAEGGSDTQVLYNNGGVSSGVLTATYAGSVLSLTDGAATQFIHASDPSISIIFDLSNMPTASQESIVIPNSSTSVTVKPIGSSGNQFVKFIDGVGIQHVGSYITPTVTPTPTATPVAPDTDVIYSNQGALAGDNLHWNSSTGVLGFTASTATPTPTPDVGIARSSSGQLEVDKGSVGQWAQLTVGASDAVTNLYTDGLRVAHHTTRTPATNFGSSILFMADDSTNPDVNIGRVSTYWINPAHGSNTSGMGFYTYQSGSLNLSATLDNTGIFSANAGLQVGGSTMGAGYFLQGDGTKAVYSSYSFPATGGSTGQVMTSNGTNATWRDTPTPTATPTCSATPTVTVTPSPTGVPAKSFEMNTTAGTAQPDWITPSATPTVTATPTASQTPTVTPTPSYGTGLVIADGGLTVASILRASGSSTSGSAGTTVADITAAANTKLVAWVINATQSSATGTQYTITITYSDSTTTTATSTATTTTVMNANYGGILNQNAGTATACSAKDVTEINVATAGTGTGTRIAVMSALQIPR